MLLNKYYRNKIASLNFVAIKTLVDSIVMDSFLPLAIGSICFVLALLGLGELLKEVSVAKTFRKAR